MNEDSSGKPGIRGLTRREFLVAAGTGAAACMMPWELLAQEVAKAGEGRKPNIILIFSDDQGYAEMKCQGCKDIPTHHMDSIAKNGVRFTSGYVTAPVCSPSRAGLLTGRYQQRFGFEHNPGPEKSAADNFGLPRSEKTIAERLKALGYATGMVGKWHVGYKKELAPPQRGFDEFFGFLGGAHDYVPREPALRRKIMRGDKRVEEKEYLTDAFAREAVAFIEKHKDSPFFLYVPFNAVHSPLDASPKLLEKFAKIKDRKRRAYATMLASMDDAIGRVLQKLREHKLEENTVIFFISDNGGPTNQTTSRNDPLRGYKAQVYEGGIRVPFMVQWKGKIPAGKVYEKPVSSLDVVPTFLAAAGAEITKEEKLDGINLVPYLKGEKSENPHEILFWRMGLRKAVRKGKWKLLTMDGETFELYDLESDIAETKNLIEEKEDIAKELKEALKKWESEVKDPLWVRNQKKKDQEKPGDGSGQQKPEERAKSLMKQLDQDGDGKLSRKEIPRRMRQRFDQFDTDGDGFVSEEELGQLLRRRRK